MIKWGLELDCLSIRRYRVRSRTLNSMWSTGQIQTRGIAEGMDGAPVCMWLINCNWIDWKGVEWMDLSFTLGLVQFVAESCWFICFCVLSDRIGEGGWMSFDDLHGTPPIFAFEAWYSDILKYCILPCYCEYPCQQDDQKNTRNEFVSFLKLHHLHNYLSDIQEMFSLKVPSWGIDHRVTNKLLVACSCSTCLVSLSWN